MKNQQNIPIRIRSDISDAEAIRVIKHGTEVVEHAIGSLKTLDDCRGFLMGAEMDGIKVPIITGLALDDVLAICRVTMWRRIERIINDEMTPPRKRYPF